MLPIVAMLVAGALSKQGAATRVSPDGAVNPLDDILGLAGNLLR